MQKKTETSRPRLSHLLLGAAVAALTTAQPAFAQDTSSDEASRSDDGIPVIIVTAQMREQALEEVPLAVTAVQGDVFENSGFDSIDDLVEIVPSLTFGSSATARGERTPTSRRAA